MVAAINCPSCGATLKISDKQSRAACLYCNSTIQIERSHESAPTAVLESTLPEADMLRIKQLLLEGQRQAAENLYIQMSGASPQAAQEALADLGRKLSLDVVRHQQLTPPGILLVGVYALLILTGVLVLVSGRLHWLVGVLLALYGSWMLYFYYPALASTLEYRRGLPAQAEVLMLSEVGVAKLGRQRVHIFALLVDVHPDSGEAPYQAEMLLPVREKNVPRAKAGTSIYVRYLPDQPDIIIYQE